MHYTLTDTDAVVTCTGNDLITMDALDLAIYATPTPQGEASQLYLGSRPNFQDDFLLTDLEDFLVEMGLDTLGWQDLSQEEVEALEAEIGEVTVTVPRTPRDRDA